ncbi:flagellar biosynthesis protein FlhA [Alicyclobacillus cycloheptanicus]|uniref:Flagellar biosynthesis protein FlhA n=1 Tax=Alicyclobacillus cycloheptanicus TaxID=1457 RepID=A0ABT9XJQ7_9BACL|nr:flagellar biosynthesis protein FlhA [Alicyclobacillus cycloheptanicus]MDQ0190541.1 flagellar biosynthesis protein FlhA [Alicyclobacillus cycloheptanicus]WDM01384.1 flagellar biosynthesis protein FlhA [Alicyclobacillus cycloheptanicus]
MKRSDLVIMIGVIGIVVMMVIPMSRGLLDVLLIINLFVSMTVLLVSMNTKEPLDFSVFPSLLLITTLYRLALNVSSTRLILTQHDAGAVIQTFGEFVTSGNIVVGFIVFLILVIIQFIVITRGAERVAEVAARFTLDAMPGKQIAIDADLNSGLITEQEARQRRQTIEREADFYGAMDGASKFVKGDAIASMLIVAINVIGGFIIGMVVNHMPWNTAASTYTVLSVGDGLVSQIPALLLSTATGLMVTRAASEANLGSDVIQQVFSFPRTLYIVAAAIFLLGFTPIGFVLTVPVSAGALLLGLSVSRAARRAQAQEAEQAVRSEQAQTKKPESVLSLLSVEPIEFEFGYALVPLVDAKQGGDLLDRVVMIRRQMALELGLVIPVIRLRDNVQLKPSEYVIKIRGTEVAGGELMLGHWLAMSPGVDDPSIVGVPTKDPAFGLPALWVGPEMRSKAEMVGYTVVDPGSVVATHLTEVLKRHAHELLGRQETKALLDNLKTTAPAVVEDVIPNVLTLGQVQRVLENLLQEKVSIRDLVTILETLADVGRQTKDPDVLTEQVRQALARQICHQFRVPGQPLSVITFAPPVEERLSEALVQQEGASFIGLEPALSQQIFKRVREESAKLTALGKTPILLTHPQLRLPVRRWMARYVPDVAVLSYNELDPAVEVESGGVVNL